MVKGYHQLTLSKSSKDLTTFITPYGRYRYERAPFGISSISEHYNRRMSEYLDGITNFVKIVDDNCVQQRYAGSFDPHSCIPTATSRARNKSRDKFQFAKTKLVLSKEGYRIIPKIHEAVRDFPHPTNISEMRSFCGMANELAPFND